MVSISKSSSGSPIHFQFQSAITGSTLTSHEVPHADCYITDTGETDNKWLKIQLDATEHWAQLSHP